MNGSAAPTKREKFCRRYYNIVPEKGQEKAGFRERFPTGLLDFLRPEWTIVKTGKITKIQILKANKEITEIPIVKADHGISRFAEHRNEEILL